MSLLWPGFLILLLLIPISIGIYILILRRRRRFAIRYSSLSLVREAASHQTWMRRHLPFGLFLLALTSLVLALARPTATVTIPSNKATIILAIDVSRSMCSTDIPPNRLEAAKAAAKAFVETRKTGRQIGIVAFSGFAELIQPPTTDTRALTSAIENLTTGRRTAIGSAILRAIDAIAEVDNRIAPSDNVTSPSPGSPGVVIQPPPSTEISPHIIVLLTDGSSNAGPFPLTAAQQAASRGIRIYTIGYGTVNNSSPMNCGDFFRGGNQFDFGGGGGFGFGFGQQQFGNRFRRGLDEETLKQIADTTGGAYYVATSANELNKAFRNLPTYVIATRQTMEISVFFTALAALFIISAVVLSFIWNPLG